MASGAVRGIVEARLVTGDLAVDLVLRVERLYLVVQEQPPTGFGSARCARDHNYRRFLGVGGGHSVDHVERARAVGDGGHTRRRT